MDVRLYLALAICCSVAASVRVPPAPVSLAVPASPVPVGAAGRVNLVYELHVADSGSRPLRLERLDVRDADRPNAGPVVTYARSELERDTKLIAPRGAPPPKALTPRCPRGDLHLDRVRLGGHGAPRAHAPRDVRRRKHG